MSLHRRKLASDLQLMSMFAVTQRFRTLHRLKGMIVSSVAVRLSSARSIILQFEQAVSAQKHFNSSESRSGIETVIVVVSAVER